MSNPASRTTGRSLLVAFTLGAVAGSIAGVVLAPQAGRETRRHVADYSRRGTTAFQHWTNAVGKFFARLTNKDRGSSGSISVAADRDPHHDQRSRTPPSRSYNEVAV
jgi:gas vesicle protein